MLGRRRLTVSPGGRPRRRFIRRDWQALATAALLCHGIVASGTAGGASHVPAVAYDWHLPRGFPVPAVPPDNPMSADKVALGRRLFFEPRLSVTGRYSCASCHLPERAFTDGRAVAVGATGQPLSRGAMSLINAAYNVSFGWTKREVVSLEQQMLEPLLNQHPVELGLAGRESAVSRMLAEDPEYRAAFDQAFSPEASKAGRNLPHDAGEGGNAGRGASADAVTATPNPVTFDNLIKAIAAFERTLIAGDSPFDHYVFQGEHAAMSARQKRGMELFYSPHAGCGSCHSGFNFNGNWRDSQGATGESAFANNGVSDQPMRVPTLRNIVLTAPYMQDGRFKTLDSVLDHYAQVAKQPSSDPKLRTFDLSPGDRADLIAFLQALTDSQFAGR
jgi:cytochrome c peroxidase